SHQTAQPSYQIWSRSNNPWRPHGLLKFGKICSLCDFFLLGYAARPNPWTDFDAYTLKRLGMTYRCAVWGLQSPYFKFLGSPAPKTPKISPFIGKCHQNEKLNNFLKVRDGQKVVMKHNRKSATSFHT